MGFLFTKMHGLGNDFMMIDGINQNIKLQSQHIATLADRHRGVGFDQCLLIEPSTRAGIDFTYRIFNADGQEVGQCGNGARCLALFAKHYGLTTKNDIIVATKTTEMRLRINENSSVSVDMGIPKLKPQDIPLQANHQDEIYLLPLVQNQSIKVHALSVGNPHAVLLVDDLSSAPVATLGKSISLHPNFPQQTNTGFMQIINLQHIKLRVYERGCGETQACGSGAVAAAAIGRLYHQLSERITVSLLGGELTVDWPNTNEAIVLTGPAEFVYEGKIL